LAQAEGLRLSRLETFLSDVVGFGEVPFTGKLPASQPAADEVNALMAELRSLDWLPAANSK
jgi:hypothetical protein